VLNGTAGERVGEMPLFKVTSENKFGSVFINPTTSRSLGGDDGGEKQTLTIGGTAVTTGDITVGGVTVTLDSTDILSTSAIAAKIQSTLSNDASFSSSSGRSVSVSGSVVTIVYAADEGAVSDTDVSYSAINGMTAAVATTREAIAAGTEAFKDGGAFLKSGSLSMSTDTSGNVTASFMTEAGDTIDMTGVLNTSARNESAVVTFNAVTVGQTVTVGGLTLTVTQAATAAQVAASFGVLANGDAAGDLSTYGTWSGTFSGFTTAYTASNTYITATSTTSSTNVTDLEVSSSGTAPTIDITNGAPASSISFFADSGSNSEVISKDLVYTFATSAGAASALTSRSFSYAVDVAGSIPALRSGDLQINGIEIGASHAEDDPFSPVNNASGSAIAKAAAINRMANATGVTRGESQMLTFSGTPTAGTLTVGGVSVTLDALDNTSAKATAKIAAALQASTLFDESSGRTVSYTAGNSALTITYKASEGNISDTSISAGSTGLTGVVDVMEENFTATAGTGVYAKVNQNVMTGKAMTGTSVLKGLVFINGFASANIATTLNNTRATRSDVVKAINMISDKTGVKAIDTGSDTKGVTLVAADGRNIEVSFETAANDDEFGARIGLRQGVQASTISLESKIPTPVVLSTDSTGDITRAGLIEGNFTRNQAVANTSARDIVSPSVAQVDSLLIGGTIAIGDTFSTVVNGSTYTFTATGTTAQSVRDGLVDLINADSDLKVTAQAGWAAGELFLTADNPGTSFTFTTSKSSTSGTMTTANEIESASASFKPLGMDDLVINGVKIPPSKAGDDTFSPTGPTSSDRSASAIAIAAAINSQTPVTGVRAIANGAQAKGSVTDTSVPVLSNDTYHSLFVNGTEIQVLFTQDETGTARRTKVVEAINTYSGTHGVTAADNGNGVTLTSDGRNLAVWFDSNVEDLSAASFGLDNGDAVEQAARVTLTGDAPTSTASVVINGITITSTTQATVALRTAALATAISSAITSGTIKNVTVSSDTANGYVTVTSTVAGSPFEIYGASSSTSANAIAIAEVTANSYGSNQVTGILDGDADSTTARTLYGTVRMIATAPQMPGLPMPIGAPPSDYETLLRANGRPFSVTSGADGFGTNSNFAALGFHEGTYRRPCQLRHGPAPGWSTGLSSGLQPTK
jgi:flagellin